MSSYVATAPRTTVDLASTLRSGAAPATTKKKPAIPIQAPPKQVHPSQVPIAIPTAVAQQSYSASSSSHPHSSSSNESLHSEIALLKHELHHAHLQLTDRDTQISALTNTLSQHTQSHLTEQSALRRLKMEHEKQLREYETRLDYMKHEIERRKQAEVSSLLQNNRLILNEQQSQTEKMKENLNTTKQLEQVMLKKQLATSTGSLGHHASGHASQTSLHPAAPAGTEASAADVTSSSAPTSSTLSSPATHLLPSSSQQYLTDTMMHERRQWDQSRKKEIRQLKELHEAELNDLHTRIKELTRSHHLSTQEWSTLSSQYTHEIDLLSSYITKLVYLLEEIDRGTYPVTMKSGLKTFKIPKSKRVGLSLKQDEKQTHNSDGSPILTISSVLTQKLLDLQTVFQRAGIVWNPFELEKNQSLLEERNQRKMIKAQRENRARESGDDENDEEDEDDQHDEKQSEYLAQSLLASSSSPLSASYEEEKQSEEDTSSSPIHTTNTLQQDFYASLTSHPTIQHISRLEEESLYYRTKYEEENRAKRDLHMMWTMQNRRIQQQQQQQQQPQQSSYVRSGQSSSMSHLHSPSSSLSSTLTSTQKLNHSSSSAASKALDIIRASHSIALHPQASKMGINIGYDPVVYKAKVQSKIGGKNSVVRPVSAYDLPPSHSQQDSRPISAVSAATTSYAMTGTGVGSSNRSHSPAWNSNPHYSRPSSGKAQPAHYSKPTPMHIAQGNVNGQVYAQQLATKVHAAHREIMLGQQQHQGSELDAVTNRSSSHNSNVFSSPREQSPTRGSSAAKSRQSSAGRRMREAEIIQ